MFLLILMIFFLTNTIVANSRCSNIPECSGCLLCHMIIMWCPIRANFQQFSMRKLFIRILLENQPMFLYTLWPILVQHAQSLTMTLSKERNTMEEMKGPCQDKVSQRGFNPKSR